MSDYLSDHGIQTRKFFWPLHLQNALPSNLRTKQELIVSEMLGKCGLYIPLGNHLKEKDQVFISDKINSFLKN